MQHQRIMNNLEINRLRCAIGIENRVADNPKSRLLLIVVKPNTLQHFLSCNVFCYAIILRRTTTGLTSKQNTQKHPTPCELKKNMLHRLKQFGRFKSTGF